MWETQVQSLGQEDPLEKELATHTSILAWRIPWTEEPGGLQSNGVTKSRTQLFFCDAGDIAMAKIALSPAPLELIVQ